jgi:hypothetical protein
MHPTVVIEGATSVAPHTVGLDKRIFVAFTFANISDISHGVNRYVLMSRCCIRSLAAIRIVEIRIEPGDSSSFFLMGISAHTCHYGGFHRQRDPAHTFGACPPGILVDGCHEHSH